MTSLPPERDPSPVLKFVAGMLLFLTSVVLVGLAIFMGRAFDKWIVIAVAIPSMAACIMLFEPIRNAILTIASKLPFVKYTKDG